MFPRFTAYMERRFEIIGGNIRDLFRLKDDLKNLQERISHSLSRVSTNLLNDIQELDITDDTPSKGYSIWTTDSKELVVGSYRIEFASEYAKMLASLNVIKRARDSGKQIFGQLEDAKVGGGLRGQVFETIAHIVLSNGGYFPIRKLEKSNPQLLLENLCTASINLREIANGILDDFKNNYSMKRLKRHDFSEDIVDLFKEHSKLLNENLSDNPDEEIDKLLNAIVDLKDKLILDIAKQDEKVERWTPFLVVLSTLYEKYKKTIDAMRMKAMAPSNPKEETIMRKILIFFLTRY